MPKPDATATQIRNLCVALYELTPAGDYVALSYYMARASYVQDRSRRQLLIPDRPQQLDFKSGRLTSRQLAPGSRVVVVVSIVKQPGAQINYGTGKDVSDETLADAGSPLTIRWLGESFIDVPVWQPGADAPKRNYSEARLAHLKPRQLP